LLQTPRPPFRADFAAIFADFRRFSFFTVIIDMPRRRFFQLFFCRHSRFACCRRALFAISLLMPFDIYADTFR